jgi:hypothetical protein
MPFKTPHAMYTKSSRANYTKAALKHQQIPASGTPMMFPIHQAWLKDSEKMEKVINTSRFSKFICLELHSYRFAKFSIDTLLTPSLWHSNDVSHSPGMAKRLRKNGKGN